MLLKATEEVQGDQNGIFSTLKKPAKSSPPSSPESIPASSTCKAQSCCDSLSMPSLRLTDLIRIYHRKTKRRLHVGIAGVNTEGRCRRSTAHIYDSLLIYMTHHMWLCGERHSCLGASFPSRLGLKNVARAICRASTFDRSFRKVACYELGILFR